MYTQKVLTFASQAESYCIEISLRPLPPKHSTLMQLVNSRMISGAASVKDF